MKEQPSTAHDPGWQFQTDDDYVVLNLKLEAHNRHYRLVN